MKVTLKDVAKEAGVSFTLVSKYLTANPNARMSDETKKRIDLALKKLNYRPSAVARSLKSGRTKSIGLVISNLRNPYFALFADHTLREVKAAGYQLLISLCDYGKEEEKNNLRSLIERQCDGIVYLEKMFENPLTEQLDKENFPLVLVEQTSRSFASVTLDSTKPLEESIRFLQSRGHHSITAICGEYSSWGNSVQEICLKNALDCRSFTVTPKTKERIQLLRDICKQRPPALLISGWHTATQLLSLIEEEFPDYEPEIISKYYFYHPAFSDRRIAGSIQNDLQNMIRETVRILLHQIETGEKENLSISSKFIPGPIPKKKSYETEP